MNDPQPKLLGLGGAHVDRRGRIFAPFVPGASNPGAMREDVGGGVFNALRAAARRGTECALFSVRGGDAIGEMVANTVEASGIADLSVVFLDRATASYTALLDQGGEVIAALADMEIYEAGFPRQMRRATLRRAIEGADAVLCDANLPLAATERLAVLTADKPLFGMAISPAKVVRLRPLLPRLRCLFMNKREADALLSSPAPDADTRIEKLRGLGLEAAIITNGGEAVIGFDADGSFCLPPPPSSHIVDATGAGDALAGATVAAMLRGLPLRDALRHGVAAACFVLASERSAPDISAEAFEEALRLVPPATPL